MPETPGNIACENCFCGADINELGASFVETKVIVSDAVNEQIEQTVELVGKLNVLDENEDFTELMYRAVEIAREKAVSRGVEIYRQARNVNEEIEQSYERIAAVNCVQANAADDECPKLALLQGSLERVSELALDLLAETELGE
jgi:hypothetical protein